MAKRTTAFVCQSCGAVYNRWKGKCEACGAWNSILVETGAATPLVGPVATRPTPEQVVFDTVLHISSGEYQVRGSASA